jgi:biopolymer transport protein ExbB
MVSHAWWNEEWNFRKEITFDLSNKGADIAGTPTDVPVLIRLHLGNFGYFGDTQPDGSDLRFVASDDKTPLKFHVERYDATSQLAFVWVDVPRLSGGLNTDKVYLYYGNQKSTAAQKPAETYDAAQVLVYHFGTGDAALLDSTAYNNKATSSTAEMNPAALIAGGAKFAGRKFAAA